jgi:hypothetical protein
LGSSFGGEPVLAHDGMKNGGGSLHSRLAKILFSTLLSLLKPFSAAYIGMNLSQSYQCSSALIGG